MALKATIVKTTLNVTDMDRHVYENFNLVLAQHPSETQERLMLRVLAFAFHASNELSFSKGLSSPDEPEIWQKSLSGEILTWIELGLPSLDRLRKASNQSKEVFLYVYASSSSVEPWWQKIKASSERFDNLSIVRIAYAETQKLEQAFALNMSWQATIEDNELWLSDANNKIEALHIKPQYLLKAK